MREILLKLLVRVLKERKEEIKAFVLKLIADWKAQAAGTTSKLDDVAIEVLEFLAVNYFDDLLDFLFGWLPASEVAAKLPLDLRMKLEGVEG